jgi:hypothetical protein
MLRSCGEAPSSSVYLDQQRLRADDGWMGCNLCHPGSGDAGCPQVPQTRSDGDGCAAQNGSPFSIASLISAVAEQVFPGVVKWVPLSVRTM